MTVRGHMLVLEFDELNDAQRFLLSVIDKSEIDKPNLSHGILLRITGVADRWPTYLTEEHQKFLIDEQIPLIHVHSESIRWHAPDPRLKPKQIKVELSNFIGGDREAVVTQEGVQFDEFTLSKENMERIIDAYQKMHGTQPAAQEG